jgi:hypothetical protein
MTMVVAMINELDPHLTRLFAQAREPLADDLFMANLLLKIERARRARMWRQIVAIVAVAVVVALNIRPMLEKTGAAVRLVGDLSPAYADMLITPWGWAVSMSLGSGWSFAPGHRAAETSLADDEKTSTLCIEDAASWSGQDDLEVRMGLAHPGRAVGGRGASARQRPRGTQRRTAGAAGPRPHRY